MENKRISWCRRLLHRLYFAVRSRLLLPATEDVEHIKQCCELSLRLFVCSSVCLFHDRRAKTVRFRHMVTIEH